VKKDVLKDHQKKEIGNHYFCFTDENHRTYNCIEKTPEIKKLLGAVVGCAAGHILMMKYLKELTDNV
jgi:hypothetical protein